MANLSGVRPAPVLGATAALPFTRTRRRSAVLLALSVVCLLWVKGESAGTFPQGNRPSSCNKFNITGPPSAFVQLREREGHSQHPA